MTDESKIAGRQTPPRRESIAPGTVYARHFVSGDRATRNVLADLVNGLTLAGLDADDLATVELILAEALNNVVEHAYADGAGPVELSVEMRGHELACKIVDSGRPMPTGDAPDPPLPVIDPPVEMPEGGFGWHIIRCLTSELTYHRDRERNTLSMRVPLTDFG
ncbi:MAG: ATP-binding protein [Rhodobacteraceae bacterium]|nr:ATP-binding protein [Paracoccaceae bacterium]